MIEFPPPENTKEILEKMTRELVQLHEKIAERRRLIASLETIATDNKDFAAKIDEAKKTMFLLVYEKLQLGVTSNLDEYIALLDKDTTELKSGKGNK